MVIKVGDTVKVNSLYDDSEYIGTIIRIQDGGEFLGHYAGDTLYWSYWNGNIHETFLTYSYLMSSKYLIIKDKKSKVPAWF